MQFRQISVEVWSHRFNSMAMPAGGLKGGARPRSGAGTGRRPAQAKPLGATISNASWPPPAIPSADAPTCASWEPGRSFTPSRTPSTGWKTSTPIWTFTPVSPWIKAQQGALGEGSPSLFPQPLYSASIQRLRGSRKRSIQLRPPSDSLRHQCGWSPGTHQLSSTGAGHLRPVLRTSTADHASCPELVLDSQSGRLLSSEPPRTTPATHWLSVLPCDDRTVLENAGPDLEHAPPAAWHRSHLTIPDSDLCRRPPKSPFWTGLRRETVYGGPLRRQLTVPGDCGHEPTDRRYRFQPWRGGAAQNTAPRL